jgi:casein kinase 1
MQGQSQILAQIQNTGLNTPNQQRRDDRQHRDSERRRISQAGPGGIVPPSPALVRHGSKQRKVPTALTPGGGNTPGQVTPLSAAAQVNVPVATPIPRSGQGGTHPYASASPGGYEYGGDESYRGQPYGRASPMVPSVGAAPPAVSPVRVRGDVGASHGDDFHGQVGEASKSSLWKILTCRCG